MADINEVTLFKPLLSVGAAPQVCFQLDSRSSPADTDPSHDAPDSVDVESSPLFATPTPAESGDASGSVGVLRSSCESEKSMLNSNKHRKALADGSVAGAASSAGVQSQKALFEGARMAVHGASKVQNSVDLETHGVCSSQLEDDLHQQSCTDQTDCVANFSEQDDVAATIKSIRRRISVADFQFAYAGYAARQGLNAVDE